MKLILKQEYDNRKVYIINDVKLNDEVHSIEIGVELPEKKLRYLMVENDIPLYEDDFADIDQSLIEKIEEAIAEL